MGLSSFPSPSESGVLPVLVMNTVLSVALLKNMVRSVFHISSDSDNDNAFDFEEEEEIGSRRRVSVTKFEGMKMEKKENCSVCLSRFREEDEVSELWCKHFFHKFQSNESERDDVNLASSNFLCLDLINASASASISSS